MAMEPIERPLFIPINLFLIVTLIEWFACQMFKGGVSYFSYNAFLNLGFGNDEEVDMEKVLTFETIKLILFQIQKATLILFQ